MEVLSLLHWRYVMQKIYGLMDWRRMYKWFCFTSVVQTIPWSLWKRKSFSAMASMIFESSLHCTISESKEMIFPRRPPYFTGKVLPCCIIDGTKCHCTGGMEPCVQWHFLNKHYLLNLCFMYSLAFNSKVSSSGASGSIWPYLRSRAVCNIKSQSTGFFGKREPCE